MQDEKEQSRKQEKHMFLFVCVVLFPLLSIMLVGGYGFIVWMSQLIYGPPTL